MIFTLTGILIDLLLASNISLSLLYSIQSLDSYVAHKKLNVEHMYERIIDYELHEQVEYQVNLSKGKRFYITALYTSIGTIKRLVGGVDQQGISGAHAQGYAFAGKDSGSAV